MPMPFNDAVMTNNGAALLTKAQAGECSITFTRMAIGNGEYTEDEKTIAALQPMTNLKSAKNSYTLNDCIIDNDYSVKVSALLTNQDPVTKETLVSEGYYINEIALFAKEKDGASSTEIMYSIAITSGERGDFMPAYDGYDPTEIEQDYYATVNNSLTVTIDITGAALTVEQANEMKEEVDERLDGHDTDIGTLQTDTKDLDTKIDDLADIVNVSSAAAHNAIFRGKYLGTTVTDAQYNAINDGTFDDLYIGDYWTINNVDWVIADFDYWWRTGDSGYSITTHHILIVPRYMLYYDTYMNETNTTEGGYIGSYMYTTGLEEAKNMIVAAFGSGHILSHREYLTNAVTSGYPSGCEWVDSIAELMNEEMVYGCPILQQMRSGGSSGNQHTIDKSQLALFRYDRSEFISLGNGVNGGSSGTRYYWWLRDVTSASYFALVNSGGPATGGIASSPYGVRPCFAICKS